MKIRVLGCGGGIGTGAHTTCFQVNDNVLLDAGTGLCELTKQEMKKIKHIFVTHSHIDHILGIPLMVDAVFRDTVEPIVVHALAETIHALKTHIFNWDIWPDFAELPGVEAPVLSYKIMKPGDVVEANGLQVEMIEVNHVLPCVGYRFVDKDNKSFAFSADTTTNDTLWDALNKHDSLDVLIVEAAFPDKDAELCKKAMHYCPSMLAADIKKLKHKPRVFITHFKPGDEAEIFQQCQEQIKGFELKALHKIPFIEL